MKRCPNCRNVFEDDQKFCSFDGATLNTIVPENSNGSPENSLPPTVAVNIPPVEAFSPPQFTPDQPLNRPILPKKSRKGLYFLLGGVGIFAVLAIVLIGGFILLMSIGGCCGADQNENTADKIAPKPVVSDDFKQSAVSYLPASGIGDFRPGDEWKKNDLSDSLAAYFKPLTVSVEDYAAREYFRQSPDAQVSMVVLKYPSAQKSDAICREMENMAASRSAKGNPADEFGYIKAQMSANNQTKTQKEAATKESCNIAFTETTKNGKLLAYVFTHRNLIFMINGEVKNEASVKSFIDEYSKWFKTNFSDHGTKDSKSNDNSEAGKINATELFQEYKTDSAAADSKYKGKTVKVSGTISASGTDISGAVFALFEVGDNAYFVRCVFPESMKSEVSALPKDQTAVLQGTIEGKVYGDVKLSGCSVAK